MANGRHMLGASDATPARQVDARWDGDVLVLTIPHDPSSIHVQRAEGQPRKVYAGESELIASMPGRDRPPYDELIRALERDWHIEASWDGLRRFWYVGLTEEGVRRREAAELAMAGRGKARPAIVGDEATDCATGWCSCGACGRPIDAWDRYCRHCGMEVER